MNAKKNFFNAFSVTKTKRNKTKFGRSLIEDRIVQNTGHRLSLKFYLN